MNFQAVSVFLLNSPPFLHLHLVRQKLPRNVACFNEKNKSAALRSPLFWDMFIHLKNRMDLFPASLYFFFRHILITVEHLLACLLRLLSNRMGPSVDLSFFFPWGRKTLTQQTGSRECDMINVFWYVNSTTTTITTTQWKEEEDCSKSRIKDECMYFLHEIEHWVRA